ncbi:hypothetical protein KP509_22G010900 [Ceratopteris richardii]|uniref:FAM86 N-terminal domain-containing protein n=1 Tax=Ceratopteris richardii TaxID=49495 RepID=A0A8T2S4S3_CERRI|nr:hypothetical protein KP509_22G010900 [Ceratopteris richardii]
MNLERIEGAKRELMASFLAMESPTIVLGLSRKIGDGSISNVAQKFLNDFCFNSTMVRRYPPSSQYMKSVLKVLILAAESEGQEIMEDLYNQHIAFLSSTENDEQHAMGGFYNCTQRCYKSYLYSLPDDSIKKLVSCLGSKYASKFKDLILTIQVSSNMLEGSTGRRNSAYETNQCTWVYLLSIRKVKSAEKKSWCYLWPAGIFLSEFILANPNIFSKRSCLEIGAGTGLSIISLALLNVSKVIATDGDCSTLSNLKHNFEINRHLLEDETTVEIQELIWESASAKTITDWGADIIVGADLIYDSSSIPYLVALMVMLLAKRKQGSYLVKGGGVIMQQEMQDESTHDNSHQTSVTCPIAYVATVIRNIETMNLFISSASQAGLDVEDVTETMRPPIFLPQLKFNRSTVCLHKIRQST